MNNLQADIYTNEAFKNFQQFKNFRNMGNIVFYKSANGKQLEVCFGNMGEVVWVESAHETVNSDGEDIPQNTNQDKNFQEEIPPDKNDKTPTSKWEDIPLKKEPITPETKKAKVTKVERLEKTYNNKTTFDKRVSKITKGWDVKDKTINTYTKIAKKSKNIVHPSKLLDKIKETYSKFKQARNKFNFFQKYKEQWEKVKRAYNIKTTLEELIEDLI